MHSWKKVREKLSSLIGDAPSSPVSHQAIPFSSEQSCSSKKSTFTSLFLSFHHPSSSANNGHKTNTHIHPHGMRPLPRWSLHRKRKPSSFKCKDRPLDKNTESETGNEGDETVEIFKGNADNTSGSIIDHNPNGMDKTTTILDSGDSLPYLTEESAFVNVNLYEFLQASLPNIVKGCRWVLLYSTLKHGISLRTLLRRSASLPGPCLLIVGDMQGTVFGGLLDSPLKPTAKRKYQGTNQTFVFTTVYGDPRLFRATGANRYYYLCLNNLLAFGGGGNFAICLDEDLLRGTSGPCDTFGNLCLAHSPEFELKNVELWGFSHRLVT